MLFRGKNIGDYSSSDILSLIENKVPESRILDYKRECKLALEQDKTEFIYDVCSFYNSEGGCIIFGIEEDKDHQGRNTGLPKLPVESIRVSNFDQLKLQAEECIKQTTNPQIVNLVFSPLIEVNGSHVFLLGIPRSVSLPAMVTYKNSGRFYKRKSTGKYQVDTYELYELFTRNLSLQREMTSFVEQRNAYVGDDRFWPGVASKPGMIMQIVPASYYNDNLPDFSDPVFMNACTLLLSPPGERGYSHRYCFEGLHLYSSDRNTSLSRYSLLFRNGTVEAFTNEPFWEVSQNQPPKLDGIRFLSIVAGQVQKAILFFKTYNIEPPYYVYIQLINVLGLELILHQNLYKRVNWNRHSFEFPSLMMNLDIADIKKQVKQIADILWQTGGSNECPKTEFDKVTVVITHK